jgi:hypothetical protein
VFAAIYDRYADRLHDFCHSLLLRHGLDGAELGQAMGVSANHAYVLLSRLRDQGRALAGRVAGRAAGREDCPELRKLLRGWDGRFSPLIRKRVARPVDGCELCAGRRRAVASPLSLLAAVLLVTARRSSPANGLAGIGPPA